MPNWCSTVITVHAGSADLDRLEKEFKEATSRNTLNADFGNKWLGNLLLYIGMDKDEVMYGKTRCRGMISYAERTGEEEYTIETESAWGPHVQCIKMFVDHFINDAEVVYTAEEPGCDLYWTNDPSVKDTVFIDWYEGINAESGIPDLLNECVDQDKETISRSLESYLGEKGSFKELTERLNETAREIDDEYFINFHPYEFIDFTDDDGIHL